jgi:Lrp/AsnC family transcriptional regulator for asnA, asnC and gidA
MSKLDNIDHEILRMLKFNARVPLAHISKEVGLSSPSIKDRIQKLENEGVILGYRPIIDYRKLGLGLTAFVKVKLEYPQCCSDDFASRLGKLPGVVEGHFTDGDEDMLLKVVTRDPENLRNLLNDINAIEGIGNTKTIISLTNPIRDF